MRALLACVLCAVPCAQEVVWERTGQANSHLIAGWAKFLGDVDGDGFDDLIMRNVRFEAPSYWREELWILSGRDGSTLRVQPRLADSTYFLDWGAAGDMDGDRIPDYVFVARDNGSPWFEHLHVRSGRDGSLILSVPNPSGEYPGRFMDVLGGRDLTGDGRPDVIIRALGDGHIGIVAAFDHRGQRLYRHPGSWSTFYFLGAGETGNALGWVGDVDRDGIDDFTLGGYDAARSGDAALVLSGRTGTVLVAGLSAGPTIGICADGCGDLDRDGVPDFVACSNVRPGGAVQAFSGRTGGTIRTWTGDVGEWMRSGGQDFDLDGVPDVVFYEVFASQGQAGISVFSGRDGAKLLHLRSCGSSGGTSRSCLYGADSIEVGRPQPGHPYPVFVFPEYYYGTPVNGFYPGRIRLYRGTPAGVEPYGSACAGSLTTPPRMGVRDLMGGAGVRLHLSDAPPGAHAILALGLSRTQWAGLPLPVSLSGIGFPGCSLFTSVDCLVTTTAGRSGPDAGYAYFDIPWPLRPPSFFNFALHGQWLVLDGVGGAAASAAHLWRH